MGLRDWATRALARQLGHPRGRQGRLVAAALNRRNASDVRAAVSAVPVRPGDVLADIGFGGGLGLELLLRRVPAGDGGVVHGVDVSETMVATASRRFRDHVAEGRLRLHVGAMERLPLPDSAVDAAITLNTIYFVPDLAAAFGDVRRVLRPGGTLVVGFGDPEGMARMTVTRKGFHLRPSSQVVEALRAGGLDVVDRRRVGTGKGAFHLLVAVADPARGG